MCRHLNQSLLNVKNSVTCFVSVRIIFKGNFYKGMHSFPRERHFTEYVRPAVEATMGKGRISHEWRSWSVVLNGDDSKAALVVGRSEKRGSFRPFEIR